MPAHAEVVIEVARLWRNYGSFEAVRDVGFQVHQGELFALLGTNGAGKTTTIEVLEGLQRPSAGAARVFGLDPFRRRSTVRPRTGVMLQNGGFTSSLTIRETVETWRSLTDRPRPTVEAVDLVGLRERLDVPVEQLSGGERRRLELALAVLGRPELLFLDEPTTGMDPASRRRTQNLIRELQRSGATVLFTTHYLEEAESLADRIAIMHAGRIATTGTPDEVVQAVPARITFRLPERGTQLPDLPHSKADLDGTRVTYRTPQLQVDLDRLLTWANSHGVQLTALSARPASLEDVFLTIADHDNPTAGPARVEAAS